MPEEPNIEKGVARDYVYAFEELENNLHPALLRRLLKYIEAYALEHKTPIFLTTHSSVALDVFGPSPHAQFIHVTHDGESARTTTVKAHFDHLNVISELGAKPSDLLQANGIIWVEGPSDRIYINKWIELFTWDKETQQPRFREGRDYQCAFYGGALLSRLEFKGPGPATNQEPETPAEKKRRQDLTDLLRVNPNIAVLCDSDRTKATDDLKPRVQRIQSELEQIRKARDLKPRHVPRPNGAPDTGKDDTVYANAHLWVTGTRDIENYLLGSILDKVFGRTGLPDPLPFATFFPQKKAGTASYLKKHLDLNDIDKVELAILATEHLTLDSMKDRFDWSTQMQSLIACIEAWNM